MTIVIVVAAIVITGVALRLAVPYLSSSSVATGPMRVNGETQLGDCTEAPNCQGSESSRQAQKVDRLNLTEPVSEAMKSIAAIVAAQPGVAIAKQDNRYLHVTYTSRWMGFVDDVEFLASDDNQSVQIRSASRLGKSDLGANVNRINQLRQLLAPLITS